MRRIKRLPWLSLLLELVVSLSLKTNLLHSVMREFLLMTIMKLLKIMFQNNRMPYLPPRYSTLDFKVSNLGSRLKTYLFGRRGSIWYTTSGSRKCHSLTSSTRCTSWSISKILSSMRPKNVSISQWYLVSPFAWLVVVSSWRATLVTLSGNYFQGIPLKT